MHPISILLIGLMTAGTLISASAPEEMLPDPVWSEIGIHAQPLHNVPLVSPPVSRGDYLTVRVANVGQTTLVYLSVGSHQPQLFRECDVRGRWRLSGWDWCGTGKKIYELPPGETRDLSIMKYFHRCRRERILTHFREKETFRGGMVVLATQ